MSRETGTVKWFSNEKGYGFIERNDGSDVFVHHSDIEGEGFKSLSSGERVEFEVIPADKGPKALGVVRLGEKAAGPERTTGTAGRAGTAAGASRPSTPAEDEGGWRREGTATDDRSRTLGEQLREKLGHFFGGN